jgi:hypothetical protein
MFDIKLEGIDEALKQFDPQKVITSARQAINRTASSARTETSRIIREEYNIKPSKLNEFLKVDAKASGNILMAAITGKGKGLSLINFDAKQEGVIANKKRFKYTHAAGHTGGLRYGLTVTALIKLFGGRVIVPGRYGNKPFIVRLKSGKLLVMERTSKERMSIKTRFGPGVGGLFGSKKIMDAIKKFIIDKFGPEFNRLLNLKR